MKGASTGDYVSVAGETVRASVRAPLPPVLPLDLTGRLRVGLDEASLALERLGSGSLLAGLRAGIEIEFTHIASTAIRPIAARKVGRV